jgi:hypothetical protein
MNGKPDPSGVAVQTHCPRLKSETNAPESINPDDSNASPEVSHELMLLLTCWYLIIESARVRHGEPTQTALRTALSLFRYLFVGNPVADLV